MAEKYNVEEELNNLYVNGEMRAPPRRFLVITSTGAVWCDSIYKPETCSCGECDECEGDEEIEPEETMDNGVPIAIINRKSGIPVFAALYNVVTVYDFEPEKVEEGESTASFAGFEHSTIADPRMYV